MKNDLKIIIAIFSVAWIFIFITLMTPSLNLLAFDGNDNQIASTEKGVDIMIVSLIRLQDKPVP